MERGVCHIVLCCVYVCVGYKLVLALGPVQSSLLLVLSDDVDCFSVFPLMMLIVSQCSSDDVERFSVFPLMMLIVSQCSF